MTPEEEFKKAIESFGLEEHQEVALINLINNKIKAGQLASQDEIDILNRIIEDSKQDISFWKNTYERGKLAGEIISKEKCLKMIEEEINICKEYEGSDFKEVSERARGKIKLLQKITKRIKEMKE